ncbi:TNF receptor-associated factor 5-like [Dreissena polymorpha]|uniref:TNF receptor-associated factor 5-like n=1 Tax=Dreissena polymorpha TaxID=45954 RepID=UPI0022653D76|nr:TNF receptor-associated factor 5-like [Dreissena polymorpha]
MEKCGVCGIEVKLSEMQKHVEEFCPKSVRQCSDCSEMIARENMEAHQASHRSIMCPACPQGTAVDLEASQDNVNREMHSMHVLSALNTEETSDTRHLMAEIVDLKKDIHQRIGALEITIQGLSSSELNIEQLVCQLFEQLEQTLNSAMDTKLEACETKALTLRDNLEKTISYLNEQNNDLQNLKDIQDTNMQRINALENTMKVREASIIELEQIFMDNNPLVSYNGVFIWKFTDFLWKQQEAQQGRNVSHYSTPFFTSRFGYKICARLYPNGDGMGKGTHLSVFFVVMKGEYDALQEWPFKQRVTFCLLNQERGSHVVDSFRPDPTSSSFRRPQNYMNIASGCPLFVRLDALVSTRNGLLKDDTIFLKIIVDSAGVRDPSSPNIAC